MVEKTWRSTGRPHSEAGGGGGFPIRHSAFRLGTEVPGQQPKHFGQVSVDKLYIEVFFNGKCVLFSY